MKTLICLSFFCFLRVYVIHAQIESNQIVDSSAELSLQDPLSITLLPGFWAKSGSVFTALIGYPGINWDCPIVSTSAFETIHTVGEDYDPDTILAEKRLDFVYDSSGNMTLVYFGSAAKKENTNIEEAMSDASISSLIYVYPNPTKGLVIVNWDDSIDVLIESIRLIRPESYSDLHPLDIRESDGKRIAKIYINGVLGYYILSIQLSDGREITKKVIKI